MKKYILSCCFLCACLLAHAQEKWTLRQCIDYAIEHNIEIMQQSLAVKNAEIDVSTSKNSRLPDLNAGGSHGYNFGRSPSPSTGIYEAKSAANTDFSIRSEIPIFTGFRITNQIKMNELDLKASIEGLSKAKENIQIQVAGLYLDVLFKKEILRVYNDQVELSKKQVERTNILVESGKVPMSQLYDIKAQLAKDEQNVVSSQNNLELSLLNLAQSLNMLDIKGFDIQEPKLGDVIGDNMSSIVPADQVYQMAVHERPHVKEAEFKVESSRKSLKVAQAGYYPKLSLGLSAGSGFNHVYNLGNDPETGLPLRNTPISKQLDYNNRQLINLSLSIPIFDRFVTRNKVRSARLNIENMELNLDNVKLALFKEIQQAYQSATAAQAKYIATENSVIANEESFKYAEERYSIGKSTVFELNDARTKLFSSRSDQVQAKYEFLFRAKILDFYSGKKIDIQ